MKIMGLFHKIEENSWKKEKLIMNLKKSSSLNVDESNENINYDYFVCALI